MVWFLLVSSLPMFSLSIYVFRKICSYILFNEVYSEGPIVVQRQEQHVPSKEAPTTMTRYARSNSFDAHKCAVFSLITLSDGHLCSGSYDMTVRIWDEASQSCLTTLNGHTSAVMKVAELKDGRVCSCSLDQTIRIWDINTGMCSTVIPIRGAAWNVIQLADGRLGCLVLLFDQILFFLAICPVKGEVLQAVAVSKYGQPLFIATLFQLNDSRIITAHSSEKGIKVWSLFTEQCDMTLSGHRDGVLCVTELADGRICSGSDDKTIRLWSLKTGECMQVLQLSGSVYSIIQLRNGYICSGSSDQLIRVWQSDSWDLQQTLIDSDQCLCLVQLQDGRLASSSGVDGNYGLITIWELSKFY